MNVRLCHSPNPRSYASRYLIPDPVLKTTTRSPEAILPARRSNFKATKQAAPSGQIKRPSFAPTSRATLIISWSSTAIAPPLDSRRIFKIRKSPIAFGTRKPEAIVCASENSAAVFSDPAECFHFVERFPHPDETSAAASRIKNDIGQLPVQLLR